MHDANSIAQLDGASDPLAALVDSQIAQKPPTHPDIENLIREATNPAPPEQFDSAIHESDPDTGAPIQNKDGSYRRKRGRRPGQVYGGAFGGDAPPDDFGLGDDTAATPLTPEQAAREARDVAGLAFGGLASFLGEKWHPTSDEEAEIIERATPLILESGGLGMPPWGLLAISIGKYALGRINLQPLIDAIAARLGGGAAVALGGLTGPAPIAATNEPTGAVQSEPRPVQPRQKIGGGGSAGFAFGG